MNTPIVNRKMARVWQKKNDAHAPKVGDLAPDFELFAVDGTTSVRLSSFQNQKPAALIFGSFT